MNLPVRKNGQVQWGIIKMETITLLELGKTLKFGDIIHLTTPSGKIVGIFIRMNNYYNRSKLKGCAIELYCKYPQYFHKETFENPERYIKNIESSFHIFGEDMVLELKQCGNLGAEDFITIRKNEEVTN